MFGGVAEVFLEGNQAAERGNQEETIKKKKKRQQQSSATEGGTSSGGASMLDAVDKDDDDISVESLTDWKEEHRDEDDRLLDGEENLGGGVEGANDEMAELTLSNVLHRSGELNLQTFEVVEQWLLLIHHLAQESALGRQTLLNAYVDNVVSKVANMHATSVYLMALCEMCIALIRTEEEEHFEL